MLIIWPSGIGNGLRPRLITSLNWKLWPTRKDGRYNPMLKRRFFGLTYAFGYENVHYLFRKEQSFYKEPQFDLIGIGPGLAWDIGCNFGLWSLYASANGYHVVAFDLSRYCLLYTSPSPRDS